MNTLIKEDNQLPKDWKLVKLGEVLSVSSGKGIKVNSLQGGKYAVYGGNGLNGYHSEYLLEDPKLIIGRVGVKCGVMHITKPKSWVTDNALIVEPKSDAFDIKFLKLKLGFENLNKLSVSTAQPVISGSKIYAYEILLPPKPTQLAIVSKIEELFSEIEKGVESLFTAQRQLKTYRQSVLKWAFEGKLTNANVKEGELPDRWRWVKLGNLLSVSSGKGLKVNQLQGGNYPVYGGNGITGYHSEYFLEDQKLIIGRVGVKCGVTHITKAKAWVTDNALIVEPKTKEFDLKFFKLKLEFEDLNKLSVSTAQPVISGGKIYAYEISFPPIDEQNKIVQEIESRLSVADKMKESINESLQQAEALKQSILKKAFEGKLIN